MTMHLNRVKKISQPPRSGHQNILSSGSKYFVRLGSIDYPTKYTKEDIPKAVIFRDMMRERLGYPKADF